MGNGKNYNSGIDVLKVLACFGVVLLHFGHDIKVATLLVPIFMFVSAYLCGRLFTKAHGASCSSGSGGCMFRLSYGVCRIG